MRTLPPNWSQYAYPRLSSGFQTPPPTPGSNDLAAYVTMAGPRIVTVPAGTYTFSTPCVSPWTALTRRTLVAEGGPGSVIVNLDFDFTHNVHIAGAWVDFVGLWWRQGNVVVDGTDMTFCYCDHTNPDGVHFDNPSSQIAAVRATGYYAAGRPHPWANWIESSADRISYYGCDWHDEFGTTFIMDGLVDDVTAQGCRIWNVDPTYEDPVDVSTHIVPGPSSPAGGHNRIKVLDSYLEGEYRLFGSASGSSNVLEHRRCDFPYTYASPMIYQINKLDGRKLLAVVREDVRMWGGGADALNDPCYYIADSADPPNLNPHFGSSIVATYQSLIQLSELHTLQAVSPDYSTPPWATSKAAARNAAQNYAMTWRNAHPYETWPQIIGIF